MRQRSIRGWTLAIAGVAAALVCGGLGYGSGPAEVAHAVTPAIGAHPHLVKAGKPHPSASVVFSCQTPAAGDPTCYGPDQIRAAYGIQPLLDRGVTGKGRTIVIVDAFSPPGVRADLAKFDAAWGLPNPHLNIVAPQGSTRFDAHDATQVHWSGEIDLDVQWAHVVAPEAKIVLVEARSDDDAPIFAAVKYAVDHSLGDVISLSYGEDERCIDPKLAKAEHALFAAATRKGITLIAAAGDSGSAQVTCDGRSFSLAASSPAADPYVLGVGGTTLRANRKTGAHLSETAWNESAAFAAAGGGGYSVKFGRPYYQDGANPKVGRGLPDVAYNASINGGVISYWGVAGGFYMFGGTSAGAPQWAGLTALAAQVANHRLGWLNPALYAAGRGSQAGSLFHDITAGNNTFTGKDAAGHRVRVAGYPAGRRWDSATGLGTPIASKVVPYLAAHA